MSRYRARHAQPVPRSRRAALVTAALATGVALVSSADLASAGASTPPPAPQRFVMHEAVDHSTESYTFTSGGPLCASGRFVDRVTVVASDAATNTFVWRVDTTYTCDDGSGTFTAIKRLVRRVEPNGDATNRGPVRFTGGTGRYVGLTGHGMDVGASSDGHGAGTIAGRVSVRR